MTRSLVIIAVCLGFVVGAVATVLVVVTIMSCKAGTTERPAWMIQQAQ